MKIAGIIAEYNPFHNGHLYQLAETKRLSGADYVICVMSGNFLQRGEPALLDKWTRAEIAVKNGIDVVIELPFPFACNSAEYFAKGAVSILDGLGCVTHLSFGSESGDISKLTSVAEFFVNESDSFQESMKELTGKGQSVAKARGEALKKCGKADFSSLIEDPNNILAVEYIKQIMLLKSSIIPLAVKRKGAGYHDSTIMGEMAGATAIRNEIKSGQTINSLENVLPQATSEILKKYNESSKFAGIEDLFSLAAYKLISMEALEIGQIFSISEGIENRMKKAVITSTSMEELLKAIKSKRYPLTSIQRMLMHIIVGLRKADMDKFLSEEALYCRVLGFSEAGSRLIRQIKKEKKNKIPIITNINKEINEQSELKGLLDFEIKASSIYAIISESWPIYDNSDFIKQPFRNIQTKTTK